MFIDWEVSQTTTKAAHSLCVCAGLLMIPGVNLHLHPLPSVGGLRLPLFLKRSNSSSRLLQPADTSSLLGALIDWVYSVYSGRNEKRILNLGA